MHRRRNAALLSTQQLAFAHFLADFDHRYRWPAGMLLQRNV